MKSISMINLYQENNLDAYKITKNSTFTFTEEHVSQYDSKK